MKYRTRMPAKVRSMELVRLLRKIDSDDVYPMMDAYYVHTLNMEIGCEHGADYITLYVPDIYRTAPPDVLEMMLRNAYTSTIDGGSTKKRSDRLRKWVYSPEFIRAYRSMLVDFSTPFVDSTGMLANEEITRCAKEVMALIPEYKADLFMLSITVRRRGLDLSRYPVASTSIPGLIISVDPALLSEGVPRVLVRFAIYHEMVRIVTLVGGLVRDTQIGRKQAIMELLERFDGLEKVRRAYVKLGWTLEQCPLDGCATPVFFITGRTVQWDPAGDGDEAEVQGSGTDKRCTVGPGLPAPGTAPEDG
ncbi:MAG: hypothetical protein ACI381_07945 [Candidatus Methanomethylophilaceae archaeon]